MAGQQCKCNGGYGGDYTQRAPWKNAYSGATPENMAKQAGSIFLGVTMAALFFAGMTLLPMLGPLAQETLPDKK